MSATPRPWRYGPTILGVPSTTIMSGDEQVGYVAVGHFLEADANLIVTAVNAYDPQLVAKVAAYEVFVSEMKTALAHNGVWVPSMVIEAAIERAETGDQR